MNETISVLIAFVGILILLSTVVQSIQEALKNILKLRVGVWERFFIDLYSKETELHLSKESFAALLKIYLRRIKMYFKRIWSGNFIGEFDKRFARLKEKLISADNTFKMLKKNLRTIIDLNPKSTDTPKLIINQLQPLIEAIEQANELSLSKFLNIHEKLLKNEDFKKLDETIKNFKIQCNQIEQYRQSSIVYNTVTNFQSACRNLLGAIEAVEDKISKYRFHTEQNIDSWIGRINEEYRQNMLKWTLVICLIFVFSFNVDTFTIYKYLQSDTKVQDEIAEKVKEIKLVNQTADPDDLNSIHKFLQENNLPETKKYSKDFLTRLESDYRTVGANDEADKIKQLKDSVNEIATGNNNESDNKLKEESKRKLEESYAKIVDFNVRLPKVVIEKHIGELSELELPLGWSSDRQKLKTLEAKKDATGASEEASNKYWGFILKKIGGLLLMAILITFGAPFWNDILKSLAGIKNIAQRK
ncbi:MAG: hypothetical protein KKC46_14165 [Proteobacteria bacterium]|nr:hypothetical protein [Pseudomonadota bacterium]